MRETSTLDMPKKCTSSSTSAVAACEDLSSKPNGHHLHSKKMYQQQSQPSVSLPSDRITILTPLSSLSVMNSPPSVERSSTIADSRSSNIMMDMPNDPIIDSKSDHCLVKEQSSSIDFNDTNNNNSNQSISIDHHQSKESENKTFKVDETKSSDAIVAHESVGPDPVEINGDLCAGDSNGQPLSSHKNKKVEITSCTVSLLNFGKFECPVTPKTLGQEVFDRTCEYLILREKQFFGLTYTDVEGVRTWVNPDKKIVKQLKDTQPIVQFEVKFFPEPTTLRENITRYFFTLQIRNNIISEKIHCSSDTYAMLGSFLVQSEFGNYDPSKHEPGYLAQFKFAPKSTPAMIERLAEMHRQRKGQTSAEADLAFLQNARKLSIYGLDFYPVEDEKGIESMIGVCSSGLSIYQDKICVQKYSWIKILKVSYNSDHFFVKIRSSEVTDREETIGFKLKTAKAAKGLWKIVVDHHTFFKSYTASKSSSQHSQKKPSSCESRQEKKYNEKHNDSDSRRNEKTSKRRDFRTSKTEIASTTTMTTRHDSRRESKKVKSDRGDRDRVRSRDRDRDRSKERGKDREKAKEATTRHRSNIETSNNEEKRSKRESDSSYQGSSTRTSKEEVKTKVNDSKSNRSTTETNGESRKSKKRKRKSIKTTVDDEERHRKDDSRTNNSKSKSSLDRKSSSYRNESSANKNDSTYRNNLSHNEDTYRNEETSRFSRRRHRSPSVGDKDKNVADSYSKSSKRVFNAGGGGSSYATASKDCKEPAYKDVHKEEKSLPTVRSPRSPLPPLPLPPSTSNVTGGDEREKRKKFDEDRSTLADESHDFVASKKVRVSPKKDTKLTKTRRDFDIFWDEEKIADNDDNDLDPLYSSPVNTTSASSKPAVVGNTTKSEIGKSQDINLSKRFLPRSLVLEATSGKSELSKVNGDRPKPKTPPPSSSNSLSSSHLLLPPTAGPRTPPDDYHCEDNSFNSSPDQSIATPTLDESNTDSLDSPTLRYASKSTGNKPLVILSPRSDGHSNDSNKNKGSLKSDSKSDDIYDPEAPLGSPDDQLMMSSPLPSPPPKEQISFGEKSAKLTITNGTSSNSNQMNGSLDVGKSLNASSIPPPLDPSIKVVLEKFLKAATLQQMNSLNSSVVQSTGQSSSLIGQSSASSSLSTSQPNNNGNFKKPAPVSGAKSKKIILSKPKAGTQLRVSLNPEQLEEVPSSAVDLQIREKYIKKLNRQERVVEEVKCSLKPYYQKRDINKEEYKQIMRKAVPKVCHSKTGEINPVKIRELVTRYVGKAKHSRKSSKTK